MITLAEYFADPRTGLSKPHALEEEHAATELLSKVNTLLNRASAEGVWEWPVDVDTGCSISGSRGGSGDGGYRLSDSTTGKGGSRHKLAKAVDVFDPGNALDQWLTDALLEEYGLWREHGSATPGWCHLQCVPPGSGRRTYFP